MLKQGQLKSQCQLLANAAIVVGILQKRSYLSLREQSDSGGISGIGNCYSTSIVQI